MPSSDLLKPTRRISSLGQLTRGMRHCATDVCFRRKADIRGYRNVSSAAAFSVNEGALFARRMSSDLQRVRRQLWRQTCRRTHRHKPRLRCQLTRIVLWPAAGWKERWCAAPTGRRSVPSSGGFMGLGVKHLPVLWDRMEYAVALDAYEINLSDEELSRAPLFEGDEEFDWGYRDDVIGDLNFYRTPPY